MLYFVIYVCLRFFSCFCLFKVCYIYVFRYFVMSYIMVVFM